jgi:hypothetical protein
MANTTTSLKHTHLQQKEPTIFSLGGASFASWGFLVTHRDSIIRTTRKSTPCHYLVVSPMDGGPCRRDALTSKSRATDEHPSPPTCRPTLWASPIRRSWDLKKSFFHSRYLIKMKWKTSLFEVEHFLFDVREQRVHYWRETSQPEHDVGIIIWEFRPEPILANQKIVLMSSQQKGKVKRNKTRKQENSPFLSFMYTCPLRSSDCRSL